MDRLEVKASLAVDETGVITGTAWLWNEPDRVSDVIRKGAVNVAVADLPMLLSHDPADLIGTWTSVEQTDEGLIVKGKVHLENQRARSALALVKGELVKGLSIGFRTKADFKQGRHRVITSLDLFEISLVRNPSHPRARVTSAKSLNSAAAVADAINRARVALTGR